MKTALLASAILASLAFAAPASAATIRLINVDQPGVGLNDPTPAAPIGGNPGTTVGQQRQIAYQYAADLWGALLKSNVEIRVSATFAALQCDANGVVLGSAGATSVSQNFPNAPLANTWYHTALASAISGQDTNPTGNHILTQFNGALGTPNCSPNSGWYYGLNGNAQNPNKANFLNVIMHEIGHGLGVSSFINKNTGVWFQNFPDTYGAKAIDNVLNLPFNATGMTNAARATAMRTPGRTAWTGASANTTAGLILDNFSGLKFTLANGTQPVWAFGTAEFGPLVTSSFPTGPVVQAIDAVGGASLGCGTAFANAAQIAGRIALIDRGSCAFALKTKLAQDAGAIGVVIANNVNETAGMAGADPTITIPTVLISSSNGVALKAGAPAVSNSIGEDPSRLAGTDAQNRILLYAPTVVATGSTFSHVDISLTPNAVMEPFETRTLDAHARLDVTPGIYEDIGWTLNTGTAKINGCDTKVPLLEAGGLIPGANVIAYNKVCEASSAGSKSKYQRCMTDHTVAMRSQGLLNNVQLAETRVCVARRP